MAREGGPGVVHWQGSFGSLCYSEWTVRAITVSIGDRRGKLEAGISC